MLLSRYDLSISRDIVRDTGAMRNQSLLSSFLSFCQTTLFLFFLFFFFYTVVDLSDEARLRASPRGVSRVKITRAAPRCSLTRERTQSRRYRAGVAIIIIIIIISRHPLRSWLAQREEEGPIASILRTLRDQRARGCTSFTLSTLLTLLRAHGDVSLSNGRSPARQLTLFIR